VIDTATNTVLGTFTTDQTGGGYTVRSIAVGPDGTVRQRSGALFTPDVIVATVPLRTSETLATRLGPIPEYVLSGLALIAAAVAVLSGPRGKVLIARRTRRRASVDDVTDQERVRIARASAAD